MLYAREALLYRRHRGHAQLARCNSHCHRRLEGLAASPDVTTGRRCDAAVRLGGATSRDLPRVRPYIVLACRPTHAPFARGDAERGDAMLPRERIPHVGPAGTLLVAHTRSSTRICFLRLPGREVADSRAGEKHNGENKCFQSADENNRAGSCTREGTQTTDRQEAAAAAAAPTNTRVLFICFVGIEPTRIGFVVCFFSGGGRGGWGEGRGVRVKDITCDTARR